MRKFNLLFVMTVPLLLLGAGCQIIVPTAQILSQNLGTTQTFPAPAVEVASTDAATATVTVEAASTEVTTTESVTAEPAVTETVAMTETEEVADTAALTETEAVAESPAMTATEAITETAAMTETTVAETAAVTETAPVAETAVVTEATVTESAPTTTTTAAPAAATATIQVASLRVRSGPSTEAEVVGAAVQGESYPITGQTLDCQWYQITHPVLGSVWIAGGEFSSASSDCAQIPAVEANNAAALPAAAPEPAAPAATAAPAEESATTPTIQPTPTPVPAEPVAEDPLPADQGCLLLQNQLGPELTFTFTGDGNFNDTVKVNSDADVSYCLPPGKYRVTVDAPPPWADLNQDFTLNAGDRFFFPIRPR